MSTTQTDLNLIVRNWIYIEAPAIKAVLNFLESAEDRQLTEAEIREALRGCARHCSLQAPSLSSLLLQQEGAARHV